MSIKSVAIPLVAESGSSHSAAAQYAIGLCEAEQAHLSCLIAAPDLYLPTGTALPLVQALADQIAAERIAHAEQIRDNVDASARLAGVPAECRIMLKPYLQTRDDVAAAVRTSDIVVLPQPKGLLSWQQGIIESVLFASGRPAIVVPAQWDKSPTFKKIVVAWDGGARAARAVGDAMPLLERAEEIEIVSVVSDPGKDATGADLGQHLARHCRSPVVTDLPVDHADAGRTLHQHLDLVRPDLVVMGAYGHSRLVEFVMGGVTRLMLSTARYPVFCAY